MAPEIYKRATLIYVKHSELVPVLRGFKLFMFMRWCFWSHLVFPCTNGHQNKPIFSCLCLWGGAFTCILYFNVQTGTKTNLFLVVYVYDVVLLLASRTSMYKQAPKQTYL